MGQLSRRQRAAAAGGQAAPQTPGSAQAGAVGGNWAHAGASGHGDAPGETPGQGSHPTGKGGESQGCCGVCVRHEPSRQGRDAERGVGLSELNGQSCAPLALPFATSQLLGYSYVVKLFTVLIKWCVFLFPVCAPDTQQAYSCRSPKDGFRQNTLAFPFPSDLVTLLSLPQARRLCPPAVKLLDIRQAALTCLLLPQVCVVPLCPRIHAW